MKYPLIPLALASLLTLTSCSSRSGDQQAIRFYEDGRAKVMVALTPIYDPQNVKLPWSLSEDLTDLIKSRLISKSKVFITHAPARAGEDPDAPMIVEHYDENTSLNIHYENLKVKFPNSEFAVFLELAKHNIHPKQEEGFFDKLTPSHALDLAMRVRIYDLRSEIPKVVLQEIVEQRHLLPKQFAKLDYDGVIWGKKTYSISPIGFAHAQFAKEVAQHIESYLILAKTQ
ncbi:MAG: hypothetical protein FJZ63_06945 [Chlamydiae bacterium]|nr:hypothetical protein [Chlamydiota bacterium]